ncbi:MAG: chemotaxis protein CheW [Burkholderiales bacterium]|nr:MAG: chemotaxis protein CheW [Burkholderiales bacterium]
MVVLTVAGQRHALNAAGVVEVLPWLPVASLVLAPPAVVGVIDYRGTVVPVVDLCRLLVGRDCRRWLASRMAVVRVGPPARHRLVALLAEGCTLTRLDTASAQPGLHRPDAPFLGPLLNDGDGLLQSIDPEQLLGAEIIDAVLSAAADLPPDPLSAQAHGR